MRPIALLLLTTAASFAIGGDAQAKTVRAKEPTSVAGVLQKAGYPADLAKDDAGDPIIRSRASGSDFVIHFYGCQDNRNCARIQFLFTVAEPRNGSLESINAWNAENYFGRAYRTEEGGARLEMDVDLDDGGMSASLFEDNLEWWASIMDDFETHMDRDGGGETGGTDKAPVSPPEQPTRAKDESA